MLKEINTIIFYVYQLFYVDDILIFGKEHEIEKVKFEINNEFKLSDIGPVDYIIGIKFIKLKDGYFIHQLQYINKILDRFNIDNYREISNVMFEENKDLRNKSFNSKIYMQTVGSLLYLAMGTRPDIMFAVSKASRKNQKPTY